MITAEIPGISPGFFKRSLFFAKIIFTVIKTLGGKYHRNSKLTDEMKTYFFQNYLNYRKVNISLVIKLIESSLIHKNSVIKNRRKHLIPLKSTIFFNQYTHLGCKMSASRFYKTTIPDLLAWNSGTSIG